MSKKTAKNNTDFSIISLILKGEFNNKTWHLIARAVGYLGTLLIIASLSAYQYGVFHLLLSVSALLMTLTSIGNKTISTEISRLIGEGRDFVAKRLFKEYTLLRICLGAVLFIATYCTANLLHIRYNQDFIIMVRVISFLFLIMPAFESIIMLLTVRLKFLALSLRELISRSTLLCILIYLYFFDFFGAIQTTQVIFAVVLSAFTALLVLLPYAVHVFKEWKSRKGSARVSVKSILIKQGKWDIFQTVGEQALWSGQQWLIKLFISTEAVGLYNIALSLANIFKNLLIPNTISSVTARIIKDTERAKKLFVYGVKYILYLSLIIILIGACLGTLALLVFFPQFSGALVFFYVILLDLPFRALQKIVTSYLLTLRKQKFLFELFLIGSMCILPLFLLLLPTFGLIGAPIASLITAMVTAIISYTYLKKQKRQYVVTFKTLVSYTDTDRNFVDVIKISIYSWQQSIFTRWSRVE